MYVAVISVYHKTVVMWMPSTCKHLGESLHIIQSPPAGADACGAHLPAYAASWSI